MTWLEPMIKIFLYSEFFIVEENADAAVFPEKIYPACGHIIALTFRGSDVLVHAPKRLFKSLVSVSLLAA
jgi:hypothetical protein